MAQCATLGSRNCTLPHPWNWAITDISCLWMGSETKLILCQQTLILVSQDGEEGPTPFPFFAYLCSYQTAGSRFCHCPQALKSSDLLFWVPKFVLSRIDKRTLEFWGIPSDQKEMDQKSKPCFENKSIIIFSLVVLKYLLLFFMKDIEIQIEVWKFWKLSCFFRNNKNPGWYFWKGYTLFRCLSFGIKLLLSSYDVKLLYSLLSLPRDELLVQWVWPCKAPDSVYSPDLSLGVIFKKYTGAWVVFNAKPAHCNNPEMPALFCGHWNIHVFKPGSLALLKGGWNPFLYCWICLQRSAVIFLPCTAASGNLLSGLNHCMTFGWFALQNWEMNQLLCVQEYVDVYVDVM